MATQPLNRSIATNANEGWGAWAPWINWISRLLLLPPTVLMIVISFRCILDPTHALAPTGTILNTPEALTDARVIGGITLTLAAVFASAILSRRRLRLGHAVVMTLMTFVLAVRMFGFSQDGTTLNTGTQRVKTTGEIVLLTLNAVGFALQTYARKARVQS